MKTKGIRTKEIVLVVVGSILFALGCNLFVVPSGIYNGGIVGTSQVVRTLLAEYANFNASFDIAGIINMLINIPLLFIAYKILKGPFVSKTILSVIVQTITFSIVPTVAIIDDKIAALAIGAIVSGAGAGMVLTARGTCGGNDVTGMLFMIKNPKMSVGKVNLYYNIILYFACALLFDIEIAIYSVLEAAIFSFVVDKMHLQNIEVSLMIFTRNAEVKKMIINNHHRGVTYWKGIGAYTDTETEVLVTIVSKYEVNDLRQTIKQMDPKAFVIVHESLGSVDGNVEKRLI